MNKLLNNIGKKARIAFKNKINTKVKNKESFRKFKWAAIKGATGVAAFALSTKLIQIPI